MIGYITVVQFLILCVFAFGFLAEVVIQVGQAIERKNERERFNDYEPEGRPQSISEHIAEQERKKVPGQPL